MSGGSRHFTLLRALTSAALLIFATGCAVFRSYPEQVRYAQNAFADGDYAEAIEALQKSDPPEQDRVLYLMELGSFQQASGDYASSVSAFLKAAERMQEFDERALLSLRDSAAFAASLLLNDKARPYRGAPFERILVHTCAAISFLMQRNVEGARVEIRRAYGKQRELREEHEKSIAQTQEHAEKRRLPTDALAARIEEMYADQRHLLEKAGNVYQNAFAHYLSSLVYELNGEISDAYIDAKTVYSLNPNFLPVRRDLLRYSREMGLRSDYEQWRAIFGDNLPDRTPPGHGEVVLLFACGLAPVKEEVKLTIPIPLKDHWTLATIAVPKYRARHNPVQCAQLIVSGQALGLTQPLMDVEATAVRQLRDEALLIGLRQLIRAAGRIAMAEYARERWGDLAFLSLLFLGQVVEQADLRCWISLPETFQALRVSAPAGEHRMEARLIGRGGAIGSVDLGRVPVFEGGMTLIYLRSTGLRGIGSYVTY